MLKYLLLSFSGYLNIYAHVFADATCCIDKYWCNPHPSLFGVSHTHLSSNWKLNFYYHKPPVLPLRPDWYPNLAFYFPTGLKLMGFKPRSALKPYLHVRPAQFIFPDELSVQGSTTLFNALLKKSLSRDVIAICRFIPRRNSAPQFVALLPQVWHVVNLVDFKKWLESCLFRSWDVTYELSSACLRGLKGHVYQTSL